MLEGGVRAGREGDGWVGGRGGSQSQAAWQSRYPLKMWMTHRRGTSTSSTRASRSRAGGREPLGGGGSAKGGKDPHSDSPVGGGVGRTPHLILRGVWCNEMASHASPGED